MTLEQVAVIWGGWKHDAELFLGLTPDGMHVHVGVVLMLGVALVTRRRLDQWLPWLAVLVFECCNEFIDLNQSQGSLENNWPGSRHDLFNTMFLPTVIMIYARIRRFEKVGAAGPGPLFLSLGRGKGDKAAYPRSTGESVVTD